MQDYRKLKVFHEAHSHVLKVRKATNRFPRIGYSSLKLQLTRATESIPFNIVEGCGAATQKELSRYLDISIKSSTETEYQLKLALDYGILASEEWELLTNKTVQIRKMLCKLRGKVDGNEDSDGSE
jgi:four helix bundle protein